MCDNLNFFILVYNRTIDIPTLNVLLTRGIKDNIYLVVGKDDPCVDNVIRNFNSQNVLVFDKRDVVNEVDSLGTYRQTLKLCTYARVFVDKYAKEHNMRYVCLLFDDIKSIKLRYIDGEVVRSTTDFDLKSALDYYIDLLNCSDSVYMVGPPGSSAYIGCKPEHLKKVPTHYANMLIYDVNKPIGPYSASVVEDMSILLNNSMIGHIGLFPMGLQINCRDAGATEDAYSGITRTEYLQQYAIMTRSTVNCEKPSIPYMNFIPKILNVRYRKEVNS